MKDKLVIDSFSGEYEFLSNFANVPVVFKGIKFLNSEAAFQIQKCVEREKEFENLNPSKAKRLGRRVEIRSDWDDVRLDVMYEVVKNKFMQNKKERKLLIETGDAVLIEGNTWKDTFWGVCNGIGENNLGKILMKVRDEIKEGNKND